ncbi:Maf family nucleotide pyrophosphatase [Rufibacter glacialis]|uniref:dTTP/UTP pyrophosphatase n=1 Tax=Rufibacter glacialis TaxID=1259555 RepID=A0A5M8QIR9_9BACT|nr:Maf family protein [Rufibacter glacialis]KAA6434262.1 septum formation protein Maf [Rufibacter glacialis]GGK68123.1 Maf-like protein [Rufibacter glacialis]
MNSTRNLILASNSPRRKELLTNLGLTFEVRVKEVDENYPPELARAEVAEYLAAHKASFYQEGLNPEDVIITADTIVCLDELVLNKPYDHAQATRMLTMLSGRSHEVYTGVCLLSQEKSLVFHDVTTVHFRDFTREEIDFYINTYKPFDKAGSYGAQDWLGLVGIERIEGSYFNVMGLPVHRLYQELQTF